MLSLYCGEHTVAEELAQDALAKACSQWTKVSRLQNPDAWVYRVAINSTNSFYRRKAAERRAHRRAQPTTQTQADSSTSVAVKEALANLSPRQRAVIVLRFYSDLPFAEISRLLDMPEATVKSHARRALQRLGRDPALPNLQEAHLA